ncbi:MAG: pyridoxamine 5'-phosphate oxidase family protein [Phycisphaeraceae bacterium]
MSTPEVEPTEQVVQQLRKFLRQINVISVATIDDSGLPHAINAYFAADHQLNLFFVSDTASAHCRHVVNRPRVAVTAFAPVRMWQQVRGVQIHGNCSPIEPGMWDDVWSIYLDKFPQMAEIEQHIRASQFYWVQPTWIRWTDNSVHFGYKVELDWPLPQSVSEHGRGASIV